MFESLVSLCSLEARNLFWCLKVICCLQKNRRKVCDMKRMKAKRNLSRNCPMFYKMSVTNCPCALSAIWLTCPRNEEQGRCLRASCPLKPCSHRLMEGLKGTYGVDVPCPYEAFGRRNSRGYRCCARTYDSCSAHVHCLATSGQTCMARSARIMVLIT
jgi:hypothetical protein